MNVARGMTLLFIVGMQMMSFGQVRQKQDPQLQTKAEQFIQKVMTLIAKKDYAALNSLTTNKVYCYLCFEEAPTKSPFIDKKVFYGKYANGIFNKDLLERLKRNETKFSLDASDPEFGDRDYIVLYTTQRPNEFGDGHEGAQFVFWLKDEKGIFKLSGVETIS